MPRLHHKISRKLRSVREFARGLASTDHPLLVHIVPIRRCNIDCGYCNEYDKVSQPVPTNEMLKRIEKLADLGTSVVAVGGGIKNPEDARTINQRAAELGFSTSIGIIHDGSGLLKPLGAAERAVFDDVMRRIDGRRQILKNLYSGIRRFQMNLADGRPND